MKRLTARTISVLAVTAIAGTLAMTSTLQAALAADGFVSLAYLGNTFTVPETWRVIDLATHPRTCVRMDQHVVYLGTPAADQDCPSQVIGRTESLLIEPTTAPVSSTRSVENSVAREIVVATSRYTLTATYDDNRKLAATILSRSSLPEPTAGDTATGSRAARVATRAATGSSIVSTSAGDYTGLGFDACTAPSQATMDAWRASSPYQAIGIYIGGSGRACAQRNLTNSWVETQAANGWHFLPLYVGPKVPRISDPATEGAAAADDAVVQATALGLGTGWVIYYDMEAYDRPTYSATAVAFLSAWTTRLHAFGYVSGVYSSAGSGVLDLVNCATSCTRPDVIWNARWNNVADTNEKNIPSTMWTNHRRVHQFRGPQDETYGGVKINIDQDYLDVAISTSAAS